MKKKIQFSKIWVKTSRGIIFFLSENEEKNRNSKKNKKFFIFSPNIEKFENSFERSSTFPPFQFNIKENENWMKLWSESIWY